MQTPLTTENTEITERIPRRSATDVHSDPESFDPLRQLVGEARVIGRFEQPRSKRPMNLDRSPMILSVILLI